MNNKHRKTLNRIFQDPVLASVPWKDIEKLFVALEADLFEGHGSRIAVDLNGITAVFHRPHPSKETDKGAVKSVRRFLMEAGITEDFQGENNAQL
jgi:hypothetical protein